MLEVTASSQEIILGIDFTEIYKNSDLYRYANLATAVAYHQQTKFPFYVFCARLRLRFLLIYLYIFMYE